MNPPASQRLATENETAPAPWDERNHAVVELGLAWLRAALGDHVEALRASGPSGGPGGPRLDELAADWRLRAGVTEARKSPSEGTRAARAAYETARAAMRQSGEPAQIDRLAFIFGLTPFDEDCLLLALAPRLDAAFAALYGYAHDRMQVATATSHLALALLAQDRAAARQARLRLSPEAPLRRFALIAVDDAGASALAPIEVDERMARFIMGESYLDPRARPALSPVAAGICPDRHRPAAEELAGRLAAADRPAAVIVGPRQSGRRAVAQTVAARFGLGLVELNVRALPEQRDAQRAHLALLAREAALGAFGLVIDVSPPLRAAGEQVERMKREVAEELLRGFDGCVFVIAEERLDFAARAPHVRLAPLQASDRLSLWRHALGPADRDLRADPEPVAEHFRLGPSEITAIAATVPGTDAGQLWAACREAAARGLDDLAERIEPRFDWGDIVLPEPLLHDLRAIVAQARFQAQVYGKGGFGKKLVRGQGVTTLFAGPSGVGKTMAAEVIARELALDLCRIDLSGVISKYIGETERNLRRVFDAAEAGGAVLFFDEADALFGKRSEVKDSHDRYANIEVSYLLQRMEAYRGLAILATNLKSHLDAAFLRRLRYVIDIPFPDARSRRAIWERAFPPETAVQGLDFDMLARLEIAGGNIMVVAVNAAFLAAAEGTPVSMAHIARAARAEFRKLDREYRLPWVEGR
jgi:hypothetical protein